jgi:hypothetical protein
MWFIYVLPIFFVLTKFLHDRKVNMVVVWVVAALLETARVHTGWVVIDEFCWRWVYFLSGYLFARHIFLAADWAKAHVAVALTIIVGWFAMNTYAVFGPNPFSASGSIAEMRLISLALGFAGAIAVVIIAALLQAGNLLRFIRYCGQNSIVIYLAFFLTLTPLQYVVRKLGFDLGWSILAVTAISVAFPLLLERLVRNTKLNFLFVRPERFTFDTSGSRKTKVKTGGAPVTSAN